MASMAACCPYRGNPGCSLPHPAKNVLILAQKWLIVNSFFLDFSLKLDINTKIYGRIGKMSSASGGFALTRGLCT